MKPKSNSNSNMNATEYLRSSKINHKILCKSIKNMKNGNYKETTLQNLKKELMSKSNKKPRNRDEQITQVQIIHWLRWHKYFCFAIPNGEYRNKVTGAILKRQGVLAGCPDIEIILNDGKVLWIEVKSKKGVQSDSQKMFQKELEDRGHKYYIVRSLDDVVNILGV